MICISAIWVAAGEPTSGWVRIVPALNCGIVPPALDHVTCTIVDIALTDFDHGRIVPESTIIEMYCCDLCIDACARSKEPKGDVVCVGGVDP